MGTLRRYVPIDRDPATGRWTGPFVMASFNTRIVRLSNTLSDWSYGRDFRYREATDFGSGPMSPLLAGGMAIGLGRARGRTRVRPDAGGARPRPAEAGGGPRRERSGRPGASAWRSARRRRTAARYRTKVGADYDPGYGGTAVMFGQAALSLAFDGDEGVPRRAGVCTPATAMGEVLVDRLREHGFTFDVDEVTADLSASDGARRRDDLQRDA